MIMIILSSSFIFLLLELSMTSLESNSINLELIIATNKSIRPLEHFNNVPKSSQ